MTQSEKHLVEYVTNFRLQKHLLKRQQSLVPWYREIHGQEIFENSVKDKDGREKRKMR